MASRPTALVNQIVDAIVLQIKTHAGENPHLWARLPKTVKEYAGPSDLRSPRPAILVRVESPLTDGAAVNLDAHRADTAFLIHYLDDDAANPARRGHEGAADIRRALAANETLTMNAADGAVIPGGMLMPQSYQIDVSPGETSAGTVEVVLRYTANYEWSHDLT